MHWGPAQKEVLHTYQESLPYWSLKNEDLCLMSQVQCIYFCSSCCNLYIVYTLCTGNSLCQSLVQGWTGHWRMPAAPLASPGDAHPHQWWLYMHACWTAKTEREWNGYHARAACTYINGTECLLYIYYKTLASVCTTISHILHRLDQIHWTATTTSSRQ